MELDEESQRIITGSDDGTVGIWDMRTAKVIKILAGHSGGVWNLCRLWGDLVISGSTDRTLILWNIRSGARLQDFIGHSSTIRCVLAVDGLEPGSKLVVSGSRDGTLRVWDVKTGSCLHLLTGHAASVRCMTLWKGRRGIVISGSYDHTLRVWNIYTGQCLRVLEGHDGKIYSVASSRRLVFSGSIDAKIRVWEPLSGKCLAVLDHHAGLVGLLHARNNLLVSGSTDGSVAIYRISKTKTRHIGHLPNAHRTAVTALDHNGRVALVTGSERAIMLWPLAAIIKQYTQAAHQKNSPQQHQQHPVLSPICLSSSCDVVWRVSVSATTAVLAYQQGGTTRLEIIDYSPSKFT